MRFGVGGILMIAAMLISDSWLVLCIYLFAALLHEMGHLLAAKALKIKVKEITFGFSGVRIVTDERLTSYKNEIVLAASGPLVNMAVFGVVFVAFSFFGEGSDGLLNSLDAFLLSSELDKWGMLSFFALSSLIQAILNLMPVKTFDGGRILSCITAQIWGDRASEWILSVTSALSALILWILALYLMLKVGGGLGIYVFAACIFVGIIGEKSAD